MIKTTGRDLITGVTPFFAKKKDPPKRAFLYFEYTDFYLVGTRACIASIELARIALT